MGSRIRVLVVDDSAVVRETLRTVMAAEPAIAAVETAADGAAALEKLARFQPDVVTLDVQMPVMDGLATLRRIMAEAPCPVIMLSASCAQAAHRTMRAFELGAVDFVEKPSGTGSLAMGAVATELTGRVVALGTSQRARRHRAAPRRVAPVEPGPRLAGTARVPRRAAATDAVVAIGASTGGPEAIRRIVASLPAALPAAVVITVHMPPGFTAAFAARLNEVSPLEVQEARHHDLLRPGRVLIAPGDRHLVVARESGARFVELSRGPAVNGHRPSVDVMFESVASVCGARSLGVLLTGMGRDGAAGLLALRRAGATTIVESEETCVVFGMPGAAVALGAAQHVLPLDAIGAFVQTEVHWRETTHRWERRAAL